MSLHNWDVNIYNAKHIETKEDEAARIISIDPSHPLLIEANADAIAQLKSNHSFRLIFIEAKEEELAKANSMLDLIMLIEDNADALAQLRSYS